MKLKKRGSTLVIAVITLALVLILGTAFLTKATYSNTYSISKYNDQQAYYAAKSALDSIVYAFEHTPEKVKNLIPSVVGTYTEGIQVQNIRDAENQLWICNVKVGKKTNDEIKIVVSAQNDGLIKSVESVSAILKKQQNNNTLVTNGFTVGTSTFEMEGGTIYCRDKFEIISLADSTRKLNVKEIVTQKKAILKWDQFDMNVDKVYAKEGVEIIDNTMSFTTDFYTGVGAVNNIRGNVNDSDILNTYLHKDQIIPGHPNPVIPDLSGYTQITSSKTYTSLFESSAYEIISGPLNLKVDHGTTGIEIVLQNLGNGQLNGKVYEININNPGGSIRFVNVGENGKQIIIKGNMQADQIILQNCVNIKFDLETNIGGGSSENYKLVKYE